jgi:putative transposase
LFSVIYDIHTASTDEWKIEKLNQGSLSPVSGLSDTERRKFRAQYTIIEENFYNLYEHVNGDITDVPYIETEHTEKAFFADLREKHDIDDAVFLVDGAPTLKDACQRHGLRFRYEKHGNRNAVERVFREIKRRTSSFSNSVHHKAG